MSKPMVFEMTVTDLMREQAKTLRAACREMAIALRTPVEVTDWLRSRALGLETEADRLDGVR